MASIRVLLVEDSNFMRMVLTDILNAFPDIEVIDTAENGKEAHEKTLSLSPDVVLLDLIMKDFDGMYAIKNIIQDKPTPIVVLSSIRDTEPGAVIDALQAGAYDFLDKPSGLIGSKIRNLDHIIHTKIIEASKVDRKSLKAKKKTTNNHQHTFEDSINYKIVAIGASTGGTGAIEHILVNLPKNFPIPIVIAQHMPKEFIESFALRLADLVSIPVKVAENEEVIRNGIVYLMPGNTNTKLSKRSNNDLVCFEFTDTQYEEYNHPSVDCMIESVAQVYGNKSFAIILTGMGKDGTLGMKQIFKSGGYTAAQDEKSSIVWGMPKAAYDTGSVRTLLPLYDIPAFIVSAIS